MSPARTITAKQMSDSDGPGITKSMGGLANPEPANAAHGQKDSHRKDEVATPRVLTFLLSGG